MQQRKHREPKSCDGCGHQREPLSRECPCTTCYQAGILTHHTDRPAPAAQVHLFPEVPRVPTQ